MDNNSYYFYLSGLLTLFLSLIIFMMFFFFLFDVKKIDSYALKKDNYISISLDVPALRANKSQKKAQSASQESVSEEEVQDVDINDLFSDVWTKKIVQKEKKSVNSKRLQEIQKKIKKVASKNTKTQDNKLNMQDDMNADKSEESASSANEVNEYLAKIQAIVYEYFNVPANSQGSVVITVIELNTLGKLLDFRVLTYSQNSALNAEADRIKERLKNVIFPINPQNSSSRVIVKLKSKE